MFRRHRAAATPSIQSDALGSEQGALGASPFDPIWYASRALDSEADPLTDYETRGWRAARSPCPLFSPAWYLAANPDVAVAGAEPLAHYVNYGWREGRDPSPLFSTEHALLQHPELRDGLQNPLSGYLRSGYTSGESPHPRIRPFDFSKPDLAMVMVYAGDFGALELALWALRDGRGSLPLTVYLVDGGVTETRDALDRLARDRTEAGLTIRRQHEPGTKHFGQLANAGIWQAIHADKHSHVGLMEQTVLTPPRLLEDLVELWAPLAVPVLNLAATEQSVPVSFDIYGTETPLDLLATYAGRRRAMIPGAVGLTGKVDTALAVLQTSALQTVGLFEEDAKPGNGPLTTGVVALESAGLGQALVARHLYAHRLERSVAVPEGMRHGGRDGDLPKDIPGGPAGVLAVTRSEAADRAGLIGWSDDAAKLLEAHRMRIDALSNASIRHASGLEERLARLEDLGNGVRRSSDGHLAWDEVVYGDTPMPPSLSDSVHWRRQYREIQHHVLRGLVARERAGFAAALGLQPLTGVLAGLFEHDLPVLVLTMDTDPITGDEKDGYVQRVIAIDRALSDRNRIYLKMVAARSAKPALVCLAEGLWRLEIAHGCLLGEVLLEALLALGAPVYSQSLVGIDPPVLRRLLPARTGPLIMDMHGAVPEEFVLYGDHYMAQKYLRYESWAAEHSDIVVCVTDAMAEHFADKLAVSRERMITCPIFTRTQEERLSPRSYSDRPRVVYAGGTQRWQMIPQMAELVADTAEDLDWVLLTPDTEGMHRALARAGLSNRSGISLRSASQMEVFATYPRCDFGVLLREEDVVNRVACPTKLIEYLRFGVIPVLRTPDVGDFARFGMQWVSDEQVRTGELPGPDERAVMAENNFEVFKRLTTASRAGLSRIAGAVGGGQPSATVSPKLRSSA
ncbi:MAG: hypothetical protein AAF183_13390 [Pseudomonadota bacterium]